MHFFFLHYFKKILLLTAKRYELRYAKDIEFLEENWNDTSQILIKDIIDGNLTPKIVGSQMKLTFNYSTIFDLDSTYYLAVKAFDAEGLSSPLSNIVIFHNFDFDRFDKRIGKCSF